MSDSMGDRSWKIVNEWGVKENIWERCELITCQALLWKHIYLFLSMKTNSASGRLVNTTCFHFFPHEWHCFQLRNLIVLPLNNNTYTKPSVWTFLFNSMLSEGTQGQRCIIIDPLIFQGKISENFSIWIFCRKAWTHPWTPRSPTPPSPQCPPSVILRHLGWADFRQSVDLTKLKNNICAGAVWAGAWLPRPVHLRRRHHLQHHQRPCPHTQVLCPPGYSMCVKGLFEWFEAGTWGVTRSTWSWRGSQWPTCWWCSSTSPSPPTCTSSNTRAQGGSPA